MTAIKDMMFNLDSFLGDAVLPENDQVCRYHLSKAIIKRRNDHYFAVIGKATIDKQLARVEVKFTPGKNPNYEILFRKNKKATIRTYQQTDPRTGRSVTKRVLAETINEKAIEEIKDILERATITKDLCEQYANFEVSKQAAVKFNL
jgi:hypothetical protein